MLMQPIQRNPYALSDPHLLEDNAERRKSLAGYLSRRRREEIERYKRATYWPQRIDARKKARWYGKLARSLT